MASVRQTPLTCSGHTRPVVDLGFSEITPHGYFLISACKDGKPMLRQGDTGDWVGTFEGHKGAVWGATLNTDATKAATGAADFSAKIWDAVTGDELQNFSHKHIVKSVAFSKDGGHLLTGSNEKLLRIFDLARPDAEPSVFSGHGSHIRSAIWNTDSTLIYSASDDKTVRVWEVANQTETKKLEFPNSPTSLELSKDGTILLITYGKTTSFWDAQKLEKIREFEHPGPINSASLHPDKAVFVCGGDNFIMYKYDYETGQEIESFKGHFGPVHCVQFSPDGELYASGSEDGTLRLWQTTVGKTYGLWKCVQSEDIVENSDSAPQIKAED
ncbi:serine-threonine kinase receptor-associated protein-like [Lingula anatina]|uniref:Serine-threonine kinase receptor-associated protein n=1 Tax=Lingula anatina TaxID=7574 RepID=A0A1S3JLK3_LINAN|nr:serine-threonine kinase receptor-associated protein-like [Lingula anatina]|eukprot:XP_013411011.1 serine-threonine kinase receptor-associated protein-like [Lingula anatina]